MSKKIKIFVAYHKPPVFFQNDNYIPIHVWKARTELDLWIIWDNTWDNISDKNNDYAELTAQYWVWKNYDLSDVDYVGFCHYRRYFSYRYIPNFLFAVKIMFKEKKSFKDFLIRLMVHVLWISYTASINNIKDIESNFDNISDFINESDRNVFLSKKSFIVRWLKHLWIENEEIWDILKKSILNQYPEYEISIIKLDKEFKYHFWNMFIMDTKSFNEYAERLFNILFSFEKELKKKWLYEKLLREPIVESWFRPYGYISELMINLWLIHNNQLKVSRKFNNVFFW